MGLDFRWGDSNTSRIRPHWSYSGFMAFRERLAKAAQLIPADSSLETVYDAKGVLWPSQFDEPIMILIDHSDCAGDLSPDQCRRLAPRLRELITQWPEGDYDREHGERLVWALEECARDKTILEFV